MAAQTFLTIFDTPVGPCGIAWNERGITAFQLPEDDAAKTRDRLVRRFHEASEADPPEAIRHVIADVVALLAGEARDLLGAPLDMEGVPELHRRVYEVARTILPGRVMTYGEIAARLSVDNPRLIGQALGRNPFAIIVPCHRVVGAGGKLGGFSATGGAVTKRRLLEIEGARRDEEPTLFDLMA
ncbi:methylated-DNA--[protein]-cysteine S-methyltransferase [Microvirga sp. 17 mud 1-3]|uniref:methylated-DNA--[protein]-cysteine S-methyltransferase n=1 Tax=Microvirga sp. 17 mud 1-3 TaxID=2082949 RepID=UPI000D6D0318|nr:methylated-DNA--[protein]-cysteine S-methyltransferase [Microvirga sp. 17 mud 1-3]AWM89005.1 cysteine methyltransferase [Microvirga sp. 17 mud 1-3]